MPCVDDILRNKSSDSFDMLLAKYQITGIFKLSPPKSSRVWTHEHEPEIVKYHLCNVQVAASSHEMTYVRADPSLPHLRM
jgi:hypothetical protein